MLSSYFYSLFTIHNAYYRFLSAPVGAAKDVPFSQNYLCWNAALMTGNAAYTNGLCFSVTGVWRQYELAGKNLINDLRRPLIDKGLLEKITFGYHANQNRQVEQGEQVALLNSGNNMNNFETALELVTKNAVTKAVANPGQLYGLFFTDARRRSAHVIGVLAAKKQDEHEPVIKYFDSANREATFNNPKDAQQSLALAVRYGGYGSLFRVIKMSAPLKADQSIAEDIGNLPVAFVDKYGID